MASSTTRPRLIAGERLALPVLCGVLFLTFLDTTIVSVALAAVQSGLHASVSQLQWVVNGYTLSFASLMLAAGALGDRLGRRGVMLGGLVLFALGSLLGALAPNASVLIGARVLMGIGAAASEPGTLSLLRHVFPEEVARDRALGAWAATSGLALAAGPVIGGILVSAWSWRAVFYFNLAIGIGLFVAARRILPESRDPASSGFDWEGTLAGTAALAAFAFAVIQSESIGWANPIIVFLLIAGLLGLGGFVVAEHRAGAPLLDLAYFRIPRFTGALAVGFALFFGIFSIFFFTALYLQVVFSYSGGRTALEFLPMAATLIAGALLSGRAVGVFGARGPMVIGSLLAGGGTLVADAFLHATGNPSLWLMVALAIAGLGFGATFVPVTAVTLGVVPAERSGMAASATNTSRELGAVFGVAVLGALVNANLTSTLAQHLRALGVPSAFQGLVIGAVETGGLPGGGSDTSASAQYGPIVNKVIEAAYGAFRSGLVVSLVVAGAAMLVGAVIALATAPGRDEQRSAV